MRDSVSSHRKFASLRRVPESLFALQRREARNSSAWESGVILFLIEGVDEFDTLFDQLRIFHLFFIM